jgi:formate-dependent nitrite reductase membrane component NrfD
VIARRYRSTSDPIETDGRDIDTSVGALTGEASQQIAGPVEQHMARMAGTWEQLPFPDPGDPTYYDRPLLKSSVWKPYIPLYYFVGGTAGAALKLGAAAQLDGSPELNQLVHRCHWIGIIGSTIGGAFLILDLGVPHRFLYMLRVFRPTSPMNMGAWILAIAPSAAITAGLFARSSIGFIGFIGETAGYSAGVFGAALATYTGVLVANTAVPIWQQARRVLPLLFGASAAASAGSVFDLMFEDPRACRVTRFFGVFGRAAELAATYAMERTIVSAAPRIARPMKHGFSGFLWKTATVLTASSLLVLLLPTQNRKKRLIAGALGASGSLVLRFAVDRMGVMSAQDPRASFHQQRAGHGASEVKEIAERQV